MLYSLNLQLVGPQPVDLQMIRLYLLYLLKVLVLVSLSLSAYASGIQVTSKGSTEGNTKDGFKIFISFSMAKSQIEKLGQIARKVGAKLVIRGLKNNSFQETIDYSKSIGKEGAAIDIDPKSFKQFDIKLVPSFVVSSGDKFDKITGNVSTRYALETFASKGELPKKAKEYLKWLGYEN